MFYKKPGYGFVKSLLVVILALAMATPALAAFVPATHEAAKHVLGQANFHSANPSITRNGLSAPGGVAVDPTTHKVFVADTQSDRVLRFRSLYAWVNGEDAEVVLGQTSFTTNALATTRNGMANPSGVFVDAAGRLWVADALNDRVLRFDHASTLTSGANATAVLGQASFTTNGFGISRNGMHSPMGVFVDASGRLWVADTSNSRVLRFDAAASKANGANADGVLGQINFTSSGQAVARNRMAYPYGVAVDGAGRLWVADTFNNRVLRFDGAASKPNGANANGVLGQINFTNHAHAVSRKRMFEPHYLVVDPGGVLYVSDCSNNRILVYNAAAGLANGANATFVLGQTTFTSNVSNPGGRTAASLNSPSGLFYDPHAKVLLAADQYNQRVLMYGIPTP